MVVTPNDSEIETRYKLARKELSVAYQRLKSPEGDIFDKKIDFLQKSIKYIELYLEYGHKKETDTKKRKSGILNKKAQKDVAKKDLAFFIGLKRDLEQPFTLTAYYNMQGKGQTTTSDITELFSAQKNHILSYYKNTFSCISQFIKLQDTKILDYIEQTRAVGVAQSRIRLQKGSTLYGELLIHARYNEQNKHVLQVSANISDEARRLSKKFYDVSRHLLTDKRFMGTKAVIDSFEKLAEQSSSIHTFRENEFSAYASRVRRQINRRAEHRTLAMTS